MRPRHCGLRVQLIVMAGLTTNNDKDELFILFSRGLWYMTLGNDFHKLENVVMAGSHI